ncbi:MAG TPA: hypothetical protein VN228_15365 [Pyrinomonadaceae bacterium]|nr:hypothetical protein [Pyrinomonadaceae bacterium]
MRRLPPAALALLLASVWLSAAAVNAVQHRRVRLAALMTKGEYDRAGLAKLSHDEREALEEWLTEYIDRVTNEATTRPRAPREPPGLAGEERGEICDTDRLPRGWVKVGDRWNPTKCGNPATIVYNVWEVERYTNKPVGAELEVCADTPTPSGWIEVSARWNPATCGHPTGISDNVKKIKRVR